MFIWIYVVQYFSKSADYQLQFKGNSKKRIVYDEIFDTLVVELIELMGNDGISKTSKIRNLLSKLLASFFCC